MDETPKSIATKRKESRQMSLIVDKSIVDEGSVQWILSMEENKPSKNLFEFLFQSVKKKFFSI